MPGFPGGRQAARRLSRPDPHPRSGSVRALAAIPLIRRLLALLLVVQVVLAPSLCLPRAAAGEGATLEICTVEGLLCARAGALPSRSSAAVRGMMRDMAVA